MKLSQKQVNSIIAAALYDDDTKGRMVLRRLYQILDNKEYYKERLMIANYLINKGVMKENER